MDLKIMRERDLLLERDDGIAGGVKKNAAIVKAEDGALDLEHDGAVNVGNGEGAIGEGHELLCDFQIYGIGREELGAYDGHRRSQRRVTRLCRKLKRRRIGHY